MSKVNVSDKCIIRRKENGIYKEQYVYIDGVSNDGKSYTFTYGYFGFHEGCGTIDQIREMTAVEKEHDSKNEWWSLPQQFYQSSPGGN